MEERNSGAIKRFKHLPFHHPSKIEAENGNMKAKILFITVLLTVTGCGDDHDSRLSDTDVAYLKAQQYGYSYSTSTATTTVTSTQTYTATETVTTNTVTTTE
jgi:hypothetical protein